MDKKLEKILKNQITVNFMNFSKRLNFDKVFLYDDKEKQQVNKKIALNDKGFMRKLLQNYIEIISKKMDYIFFFIYSKKIKEYIFH